MSYRSTSKHKYSIYNSVNMYIYIMLTMTSLHAARETDFSFNSAAWEQSAPGAKDGAPPPAHTSYMFKRKALDFPRPLESMIKDL